MFQHQVEIDSDAKRESESDGVSLRFTKTNSCEEIVAQFLPYRPLYEDVADYVEMRFIHSDHTGTDKDLKNWCSHCDRDVAWITDRLNVFGDLFSFPHLMTHIAKQRNVADWCSSIIIRWPDRTLLLAGLALSKLDYLPIAKWCRTRFPTMTLEELPFFPFSSQVWTFSTNRFPEQRHAPEMWEHWMRDWAFDWKKHFLHFPHSSMALASPKWHMFPFSNVHIHEFETCKKYLFDSCASFHPGKENLFDWLCTQVQQGNPKWLTLLRRYDQHRLFLEDSSTKVCLCLDNNSQNQNRSEASISSVKIDHKSNAASMIHSKVLPSMLPTSDVDTKSENIPIHRFIQQCDLGYTLGQKTRLEFVQWLMDASVQVKINAVPFLGVKSVIPILRSLVGPSMSPQSSSSTIYKDDKDDKDEKKECCTVPKTSVTGFRTDKYAEIPPFNPREIPPFQWSNVSAWEYSEEHPVTDADLRFLLDVYGSRLVEHVRDWEDAEICGCIYWERIVVICLQLDLFRPVDVSAQFWFEWQKETLLHNCTELDTYLLSKNLDIYSFGDKQPWSEFWKECFLECLVYQIRHDHFKRVVSNGLIGDHEVRSLWRHPNVVCISILPSSINDDLGSSLIQLQVWPALDPPIPLAQFLLDLLLHAHSRNRMCMSHVLRIICAVRAQWKIGQKQEVAHIWRVPKNVSMTSSSWLQHLMKLSGIEFI